MLNRSSRFIAALLITALAACSGNHGQTPPLTQLSAGKPTGTMMSTAASGCDSSISANFNGVPIAAGSTVWFTAVMKVSGIGNSPVTLNMSNSTISFMAGGTPHTIDVPNSSVKIDPTANKATIGSDDGGWTETVPYPFTDNVLLNAVQYPVASALPGGIHNVTWSGHVTSTQQTVSVQWNWSAAVYKQFNSDYNALGVKPVHANDTSQYLNSDHAGTPENYKSYVTDGATGDGGSNYTGGLSDAAAVATCLVPATLTTMPTARYNLAAGVVNGVVYAIGGYNTTGYLSTVEAYDPTTNSWTTRAPMPTPRYQLGVGVINGILYAVGGANANDPYGLATLEAYDASTNTWTEKASMPTGRYGPAVGVINGVLYVAGGANDFLGFLNSVEAYDPATNTWSEKPPLPTARFFMAAGVINGVLYTAGGYNGSYLNAVEAYDPGTNTWTEKAPIPTARQTQGDVLNGLLYAVGGYNNAPLGTVEAYNPSTDTWTTESSLATPRNGLGAATANGELYAIGGYNNGYLSTVEAINP